jgi:hypothetical protein
VPVIPESVAGPDALIRDKDIIAADQLLIMISCWQRYCRHFRSQTGFVWIGYIRIDFYDTNQGEIVKKWGCNLEIKSGAHF